jgi:hypothetical protein
MISHGTECSLSASFIKISGVLVFVKHCGKMADILQVKLGGVAGKKWRADIVHYILAVYCGSIDLGISQEYNDGSPRDGSRGRANSSASTTTHRRTILRLVAVDGGNGGANLRGAKSLQATDSAGLVRSGQRRFIASVVPALWRSDASQGLQSADPAMS